MGNKVYTGDEIRWLRDSAIVNLGGLCRLYDEGMPGICFIMASEIAKILTINHSAASIRKGIFFTSPKDEDQEANLAPFFKLITGKLTQNWDSNPPNYFEFLPTYLDRLPTKDMEFVTWWNRDIVWRASAAKDQSDPSMIPVREEDQVPYRSRAKYSRREIITLVRNKLGAHLDNALPEELDRLQRGDAFGIGVTIHTPEGALSNVDGTLPMRIGPLPAMIRQIAEETRMALAPTDQV